MAPRPTTGTAITGHGVWHPAHVLTNAELCVAFNEFVRRDNARHAAEIAAGTRQPLKESSPEFIEKASGIQRRYVEDKTGLMDPERMCPNIPDRPEDQLSIQAEYSVRSAKLALERAGRSGEDVDLVGMLRVVSPYELVEPHAQLGVREDMLGVPHSVSGDRCTRRLPRRHDRANLSRKFFSAPARIRFR